jgi:hypothetical protein
MPVGRTPPRRASRGSGAGYGKREKKAVVPFTPEPEKKKSKRSVALGGGRGGRGSRGGRGGRGGRGAKRGNDDPVVNKVRAGDSSPASVHLHRPDVFGLRGGLDRDRHTSGAHDDDGSPFVFPRCRR